MITIKINNIPILLKLKYESNFTSLSKYKTLDKEECIMETVVVKGIDIPNVEPTIKTIYYDTYFIDDYELQIQKYGDYTIGGIKYEGNKATILLLLDNYETEYLLTQYAMVHFISKNKNAILMHGSSLMYMNKGIIFTAKSGTGKSTHSRLWQKHSDSIVINDDKNIISLENDKLYISSSPWSGKHHLDNNIKTTLDAIVILYQNKTNVLEKISKIKAFKLLFNQLESVSNKNKDYWNTIFDKILELPIYYYGCNMEDEAFMVIEKEMREKICQ